MDRHRKTTALCEGLAEYMLGEGTEVERKRFERHLAECAACRTEAAEWDEIWGGMYRGLEEVEPPADLKKQVMRALDEWDASEERNRVPASEAGPAPAGAALPSTGRQQAQAEAGLPPMPAREPLTAPPAGRPAALPAAAPTAPTAPRRRRRAARWAAGVAALALVFSAGWAARDRLPAASTESPLSLPAADQIDSLFHLVADSSSGLLSNYPRAYGVACVVSSAPDRPKQLIVYLFGAPKTKGGEAYQVWLWDDGNRRSAGTLRVADAGIGILTMTLADDAAPIQAVGVTLEPNGPSEAPQGPKLFGSAPDDPAWET